MCTDHGRVSTELLLTFPPSVLRGITVIPLDAEETAGRFRVWLYLPDALPVRLIWDRKIEGGFPELKVLVGGSWLPSKFHYTMV
jgi:predicted Rdx family selenoprotein